jgi:hypothetical protein
MGVNNKIEYIILLFKYIMIYSLHMLTYLYNGLPYLDYLYVSTAGIINSVPYINTDDCQTYNNNMSDVNYVNTTCINHNQYTNYYNYESPGDPSPISYTLDEPYQPVIQRPLITSQVPQVHHFMLGNNYNTNNKQKRINKLQLYQRRRHKRY